MREDREPPRQQRPPRERAPRREPPPSSPEQEPEAIDIGEQVGVALERLKKRDIKQTALIAFVIGVLFHACVIYAVLGSGGGKDAPAFRGVVDESGTPLPTPTATADPTNRRDCTAIAGTQYRSEDERAWFLANCRPG